MKKIQTSNYPIYFIEDTYQPLIDLVEKKNYSKIFILVDTHTNEYCLMYFLQKFPFEVEVIEIETGEEYKNIETCLGVWGAMSELGADRKSLLINLGGGVVTDLGGFVASTYMRGIDFINIPTSLLAMVDASVGGKTGVDLGMLKNQIGVINTPEQICIDIQYLQTLPSEELRSGLAEMFKHGLIYDENYWNQMTRLSDFSLEDLQGLIYDSVQIKNQIVTQDPTEKGLRKILNFGHTLGHAIESFCLQNEHRRRLLHGEAIIIGIILASFLSVKKTSFPQGKCDFIKENLLQYFEQQSFTKNEISEIISLMKFDKKNSHGAINFVLLEDIANPKLDCHVDNDLIYQAFEYYVV